MSPVGEHIRNWACQHFQDVGEPLDLAANENSATVFRLTAIPSFFSVLVVRIEIASSQRAVVTVRTRYPIPGGAIASDDYVASTTLDEAEIRAVVERTAMSGFWNLPPVAAPPPVTLPDGRQYAPVCGDGTTVNVEGLEAGRYHVSRSDCVTYPEMIELIASILELANRKFPGLHRPWMEAFIR